MSSLKNKIAVVTGGSSGIGVATAKRFVEEGAYVFIAGRREAELDKAVADVGRNVTGVKTDISKLDDLDRLYEAVANKGKIDVIFAGARIRTNVLSPGPVDTPMFDEQFPSKDGAAEARQQIMAMTPLARLARPEEIASTALFLASDQSSYVAGIDLLVDGGLTAV
ncbi:MAG TPA: SDR family oxidoreductase [Steroidobacteraceae bacterium]|nr:SDR family oxidoreductase [Steroidobacteraceae bacterium]